MISLIKYIKLIIGLVVPFTIFLTIGCSSDSSTENNDDTNGDSNAVRYYRYIEGWSFNNELTSYITCKDNSATLTTFDSTNGESTSNINTADLIWSELTSKYVVYQGDIFYIPDTSRDISYHTYNSVFCIPDEDISPVMDLLYIVETYRSNTEVLSFIKSRSNQDGYIYFDEIAETAFEQKDTDSVHVETQNLNIDIDLTQGSQESGYVGIRTFNYDSTVSPVRLKCFVQ